MDVRPVWQGRLFLSLLLVGAAMPVSVAEGVPVVNTIRILDVLLLFAALTLLLDASLRPLDLGYRQVFWILTIPLLLSIVSIVWSQDRPATLRAILIYAEGVVAYLFVVRELDGLSPARIVAYLERFLYLLIIPAILLLLHVPGFEPPLAADVSETSGDYLRYFTRLSHPILGSSNNLAAILAFLAPLLVYWGLVRGDRRISIAGAIGMIAVLLTLSRGTLLSFVIAAALYAVLAPRGRRARGLRLGRMIAKIAVFGGIALLGFYVLNPATRELVGTRFSLKNLVARVDLLTEAWAKVENHPVLGYGSGVAPDGDILLGEGVHNTFVQQILYFGIPLGFFLSVVLLGLAGFFLARRRRTAIAGVVAYVMLVELVSFVFQSTFEGTILRVLFYMCVGLAVALVRAVELEESGVEPRRSPTYSAAHL